MARVMRRKSSSGIYHVTIRGVSRQHIFEQDEDCHKFLYYLRKYKEELNFNLYAYCLMGNHAHLLIKENEQSISVIMRRLCSSYAVWFNTKYERVGYLFQDRFYSDPVENMVSFTSVLRYIFQNPLKAGIIENIEKYRWSNCYEYMQARNLSHVNAVLTLFHSDRKEAIIHFRKYIVLRVNDRSISKLRLTDTEARKVIKAHCNIESCARIQDMSKETRNKYIAELKDAYGFGDLQLERITGISRGVIRSV